MSLKAETLLKGIGVSPGIVIGPARVLIPDVSRVSSRRFRHPRFPMNKSVFGWL